MADRIEDGDIGHLPAFPVPGDQQHPQMNGMSLRDWFAGQALAGLYASGPHDCDQNGIAHDSYLAADAMLSARQKGGA